MKKIYLSGVNGIPKFTTVDNEDYAALKNHVWNISNGYVITSVRVNDKQVIKKMHRIIMDCPLGSDIDHINRNKLDNCRKNLRICTRQINILNRGMLKNNKSGYKGVSFSKTQHKWRAYIRYEGKNITLGYYNTAQEAAISYENKWKELFGAIMSVA